ncbi:hypothetical protein PSN45_002556 [Yamadazyma tenuis]|uniref:Uncharacterized protein n=1 Tax=Candida tenuis (strain ATCC 10573 / BCRC 21748 / CBS 615 / JCM 9827 / NBRC 10315 / NRRL Y-1498 / VKM Y-70) TaxID=590646 RepID=G3B024_CANTC|nr:uncharacterized protein CANTEDRAFT_119499 [Yamadazyma tenuis ATCC 10573]EGV65295.1 hypothetical protein CANTEDRAFT_119499 [Yamadazyma tenuis ATCC 10573]WEJ95047.1 hypothetical protein PSN45_002556 [Yamadazyma tenuis]
MDIVNQSIITVGDLDGVDDRIIEVEQLIQRRNADAHSKLKANVFEDESTTLAVATIIQKLRDLNVDDPRASYDEIVKLGSEYPHLAVVDDLKELYRNKQSVCSAQKYLLDAELIEQAIEQLSSSCIENYQSIFDQMTALDANEVSSDLSVEVEKGLIQQFDEKIEIFKGQTTKQLETLLRRIDWLGSEFSVDSLKSEDLTQINALVSSLVSLQSIGHRPVYPDTWWATDILLEPFTNRFNFHFNTKRDTNKLSRPEWAFSFMEEFVSKNIKLFELVINQAFKPVKLIMLHQVISSALVPIRQKVLAAVGVLNEKIEVFKVSNDSSNYDKSGRLLSHLIYELTSFDQRIRNNYKFNPFVTNVNEVPSKKWMGLTADVLLQGDKERLGTSNWLNFESILANNRFKTEIIEDSNALRLDLDYKSDPDEDEESGINRLGNQQLKPTYSALNLVKLFNNLTTHYSAMRMVKFQLKYVSNIQLRLLENYHDYLKQALKRYDDNYSQSTVLNLIPGGLESSSNKVSSISDSLKGLQMLTEIFCSAKFISHHLGEWGEELVFIQLWKIFKTVAQKDYKKDVNIFGTCNNQYNKLIEDIRGRYGNFFRKGTKDNLKDYINESQWEIQEVKDNSAQFGSLIHNLPVFLNDLHKVFIPSDYYMIVNQVLSSICGLWYEYIITNNRFSRSGVRQLEQDFEFVIDQLRTELLVDNQDHFSTAANFDYNRITQSIGLFKKYDSVLSKSLVKNFDASYVRSEFESQLSNLHDEEIRNLLFRVA